MFFFFAYSFSFSTSLGTKWGVQKRFQRGTAHIPTTYFLGYDTDEDGNLVINEDEAPLFEGFIESSLMEKEQYPSQRD